MYIIPMEVKYFEIDWTILIELKHNWIELERELHTIEFINTFFPFIKL